MRFGLGMNSDHTLGGGRYAVLGDARANSADRGQGAAEAQALEPSEGSSGASLE